MARDRRGHGEYPVRFFSFPRCRSQQIHRRGLVFLVCLHGSNTSQRPFQRSKIPQACVRALRNHQDMSPVHHHLPRARQARRGHNLLGSNIRAVIAILLVVLAQLTSIQVLLPVQGGSPLCLSSRCPWYAPCCRRYSFLWTIVDNMDLLYGAVLWVSQERPSLATVSMGQSE